MDAKYIRFINKGEADVTFDINSVSLTNTDADKTIFAEPAGVEGFDAKQAIDNSLTTMFRAGEGAGTLTYRLDAGVKDKPLRHSGWRGDFQCKSFYPYQCR